ncbi:2356_t:CDS:2, partial [Acaulospora colombiana]
NLLLGRAHAQCSHMGKHLIIYRDWSAFQFCKEDETHLVNRNDTKVPEDWITKISSKRPPSDIQSCWREVQDSMISGTGWLKVNRFGTDDTSRKLVRYRKEDQSNGPFFRLKLVKTLRLPSSGVEMSSFLMVQPIPDEEITNSLKLSTLHEARHNPLEVAFYLMGTHTGMSVVQRDCPNVGTVGDEFSWFLHPQVQKGTLPSPDTQMACK